MKLDMETTIRGMLEQDIESLTQPNILEVCEMPKSEVKQY